MKLKTKLIIMCALIVCSFLSAFLSGVTSYEELKVWLGLFSAATFLGFVVLGLHTILTNGEE
jgi:L-asparagine transporter-like permease